MLSGRTGDGVSVVPSRLHGENIGTGLHHIWSKFEVNCSCRNSIRTATSIVYVCVSNTEC